jgi:hypothetical protein
MTTPKDDPTKKFTNDDIEEILEWTPEEEEEFLRILENVEKNDGGKDV